MYVMIVGIEHKELVYRVSRVISISLTDVVFGGEHSAFKLDAC